MENSIGAIFCDPTLSTVSKSLESEIIDNSCFFQSEISEICAGDSDPKRTFLYGRDQIGTHHLYFAVLSYEFLIHRMAQPIERFQRNHIHPGCLCSKESARGGIGSTTPEAIAAA